MLTFSSDRHVAPQVNLVFFDLLVDSVLSPAEGAVGDRQAASTSRGRRWRLEGVAGCLSGRREVQIRRSELGFVCRMRGGGWERGRQGRKIRKRGCRRRG